jgi:long-chain acyl-CoA synthetase
MLNNTHLSNLIYKQAEQYGDRTALKYRDYEKESWIPISWNEFAATVRKVSKALLALQTGVQENLATFSQNKPECLYVDFGAYGIRAITIPFYATSSGAQVKYMIQNASVHTLFVGEQQQYDVAFSVLPLCDTLERIVIFDPTVKRNDHDTISIYFDEFLKKGDDEAYDKELDQRLADANFDDLANILYTSGTTGGSKGVMISYEMYHDAFPANDHVLHLDDKDVILNFLPFTHIFERAWSYLCIAEGCTLCVNLKPQDVLASLQEVHPSCMCSVPRFWEKVYIGVKERMDNSSLIQRRLMEEALQVGKRYNVDYRCRGLVPPLALRLRYKFFEKTVIALLRSTLGLENANFFPTAGATVSPVVQEFINSVGIHMVVGYGATETTATVTCNHMDKPLTIGSVGRFIEGVEAKIGDNSEILLRGKTISKGYYHKETLTKETFDQDGWFHTGDAGYIKNGELFLNDRIKDLFKTSNGKYIAPQMIESKFVVDRYIDQVSVIADQHKFVSALIVPNYKLLEDYAHAHGIAFADRKELCSDPKIVWMMMERIELLQQEFASYEKVKRITLLPEAFSIEKGELTNTLKIIRPVLYTNYERETKKMYDE